MSALWTSDDLVAAMDGRPVGRLPETVGGISIDTRSLQPGDAFFAIKGDRFDGHDFATAAMAAGAGLMVVSEARLPSLGRLAVPMIVVDDVLAALGRAGVAARARSRAKIIAVTGSAGKTTTKEALRVALSPSGKVHASDKSFNNHWGVPLMLARLPQDADFAVFEIGMNHAGEITPLVKMVRPHIAVITTVAAAHLEFFNSVADIAVAKAEIFLGLEPGGTALLNADHDHLHILFAHARAAGVGKVVTYGFDDSADWHIGRVDTSASMTLAEVTHGAEHYDLRLQVPGRHMVANAVAALAVAQISGEGTRTAVAALAKFGAPEGRGLTLRLGPGAKPLLLVDESYNANVASMTAAMDLYSSVRPPEGRKFLVLGDMLEMGPQGPQLHAGLASAVLKTGATEIYLVGPAMRSLADELRHRAEADREIPGVTHMTTAEEISDTVLSALAYGDAVMVKGSKGVRLSPLVQKIRERFQNA